MAPKAIITDIHSLSTHDGPGIRTTIFFKGCSLNCVLCHNPETINRNPEIEWDAKKCLNCRTCEEVCPENAISFNKEKSYIINKIKCNNCGLCADKCPSHALKVVGTEYSVDELVNRILKDEKFIKRSNGGVTFSGGEPALHCQFISDLAKKLKAKDFHLALDTCGMASKKAYEELLPDMDLILFDVKEMDSQKHKAFTGVKNEMILNNLLSVRETITEKNLKTKLWIRTPLIPGMTDTTENILAIGEFLSDEFSDVVQRWQLCAFNNLCKEKYRKLGLEWSLEHKELLSASLANKLLGQAKIAGKNVCDISFSGLTQKVNAGI